MEGFHTRSFSAVALFFLVLVYFLRLANGGVVAADAGALPGAYQHTHRQTGHQAQQTSEKYFPLVVNGGAIQLLPKLLEFVHTENPFLLMVQTVGSADCRIFSIPAPGTRVNSCGRKLAIEEKLCYAQRT